MKLFLTQTVSDMKKNKKAKTPFYFYFLFRQMPKTARAFGRIAQKIFGHS